MISAPGNIVRARGRDWVVQSGSDENLICLRPLTGASDELAYLCPSLETVAPATFPYPDKELAGNLEDGALFRNSVMLRLRDSAGPLRCLGHIAVEPRSFQLTPLLMALRMQTVRLLIADDVGIGKTIEAGLIAREYLDRFEIQRISVLCPPHLVEQWVDELQNHFNLNAVALTSSSVYTLEKTVPAGMNLTEYYPITVVSLDYIKNQNRRDNFIHTAPEFIIIDEAHTCTDKTGKNSQLRFNLISELSKKTDRHIVMLTATPHSGDNEAFGKLLSIIDPKFEVLGTSAAGENKELRTELGLHFIQRQRKDIESYKDNPNFAQRLRNEFAYHFNGEWKEFFEATRKYCADLGKKHGTDRNPTIWYAILALYRSIASSPASAIKALENRLSNVINDQETEDENLNSLLDMSAGDAASDVDVSGIFEHTKELKELLESARILMELKDPKYDILLKVLKKDYLENEMGYRPIIFCKYIATAKYIAEKLKKDLPSKYTVEVITGEQSSEEREIRVQELSEKEYPVLVATDCLSEGINLQHIFNGVIHYDLAWNPTRHEQREGRVDRFGQNSKTVKCAMIYGEDNPVDGLILKVILRKANAIRDNLGVMVPIPDDDKAIQNALIQATLLKQNSDSYGQLFFDFDEVEMLEEELEKPWENATEKAKINRTIFAQRSIHADEVYSVLKKEQLILGTDKDVESFVCNILARLGARPEKIEGGYHIKLENLPSDLGLKERMVDAGVKLDQKVSFSYPPSTGFQFVHRTHPIVEQLASFVFEYNMENLGKNRRYVLGSRCSVTETADVSEYTVLYMIRLRMQIITVKKGVQKTSIAEESVLLEDKKGTLSLIDGDLYKKYLTVKSSGNIAPAFISNRIHHAIQNYDSYSNQITEIVGKCAEKLRNENDSVRQTFGKGNLGQLTVKPCMPVDLLGVYVLVPAEEEL